MIKLKKTFVGSFSSVQNDILRVRWKRFLIIPLLCGKFALMLVLFLLIFSCSSNQKELNGEINNLKQKIFELEDSLSKVPKYFIFKNINTVSVPVDKSDDSVTYKLMIVADNLLINGSFVGVEVKEKNGNKGKIFKKDGFNYLNYPISKDGQNDTLIFQYEFRDTAGTLFFKLMDEIILE